MVDGEINAMGWIGFVLWRYAEPSVTGICDVFYLVMGYAVVKLCGQLTLLGAVVALTEQVRARSCSRSGKTPAFPLRTAS